MTVLNELLNKIANAKPNQRTISIPMGMAVKIAFALERLGKIMLITDDITKNKYTELDNQKF